MDLQNIDIDFCINQLINKEPSSQLGFFSKPYRISINGTDLIVKRYHPIRRNVATIIESHNEYIETLRAIGINVPDTKIVPVKKGTKQELIIFQHAFKESELLRTRFSEEPLEELLHFLKLLYDEITGFWANNPSLKSIGFHPTLRNYAMKNGKLYYFDSFPPMNMTQFELNRIILQMAPVPDWIKFLVPVKAINRVSDEYYVLDKMLIGVLGSSVRLRPEYADELLRFTENYISTSNLSPEEKESISTRITTPPKLSFLWRFIRKVTGNIGQPNVTMPSNKTNS